jgi:hypothetical protein
MLLRGKREREVCGIAQFESLVFGTCPFLGHYSRVNLSSFGGLAAILSLLRLGTQPDIDSSDH